jgi:hypothetical protein
MEKRVFEGPLGRENEMRSDDPYVVVTENGKERLAWVQEWLKGLDGKKVRITVEVLE